MGRVNACEGGSLSAIELEIQTLDFCRDVGGDVAANKLTFSPQAAAVCLSDIQNTACGLIAASGLPFLDAGDCANVYTGTVPPGGSCFPLPMTNECEPGNWCDADNHCPGICQPNLTLGEACNIEDASPCAAPLYCGFSAAGDGSAACAMPAQAGASCSASSASCPTSNGALVCEGADGPVDPPSTESGTCQYPPATGPCSFSSDCSTGYCASAIPGTMARTCAAGKIIGDTCTPGNDECGPGTYCGVAETCVVLPSVGQSCAGNGGEGSQCLDGVCNPLTLVCVPYGAPGASCAEEGEMCDGINTRCATGLGVCLPTCAPGSGCGGAGQLCCAGGLCNVGFACAGTGTTCESAFDTDSSVDAPPSTGIAIISDSTGYYDGSNAAGVVGPWWAGGDDYGSNRVLGAGNCPMAGFPDAECSVIHTPKPGQPFAPDPNGRMCTSGIVAQVLPDDGSAADYTAIWGNVIAFDFNNPGRVQGDGGVEAGVTGVDSGAAAKGQYDALAHGITGLAFDIDTPPAVGNLRVEFQTQGTEQNGAYWEGAVSQYSPVNFPGHYEIRWPAVGGPFYLINDGITPPPFDPTKLETVSFHVTTNAVDSVTYAFCISNIIMLTN